MSTFVIGDIHAKFKALEQVIERSGFKPDDLLISIGDIVDRGPEPFECIWYLSELKNKILIMGNHDYNFYQYIKTGHDLFHGTHGAHDTITKWKDLPQVSRSQVFEFFESQVYYHVQDNKCFVHGGFDPDFSISQQPPSTYFWDRDLWLQAMSCKGDQKLKTVEGFDEIFVGHTPTINWRQLITPITHPMHSGGVWNVDTGAGFPDGKLTMMNIDSHEYFQSDMIKVLYNINV